MAAIVGSVIGTVAAAIVAALIARVKLRKPDGYCRTHRVAGELKGVRLGADRPNWWCLYGQHYIDRRGREYEPPDGEKRAAWALMAALAALVLWRRNK